MSFPWKKPFPKLFLPRRLGLQMGAGKNSQPGTPPASPEFLGQRSKLWSLRLFTHLWLSLPEGLFQAAPRCRASDSSGEAQPDVKLMGRSQASASPPPPQVKSSGSSSPLLAPCCCPRCPPSPSLHRASQEKGENREMKAPITFLLSPPRARRQRAGCSALGGAQPAGRALPTAQL